MTKAEFIALAEARYESIHSLKDQPTFLDYEASFVEIWTELGRTVLEENLGKPGKDRRVKKKLPPSSDPLK